MSVATEQRIFDKELTLPNDELTVESSRLHGFEARYAHISQQLQLLMHLGDLENWSLENHGVVLHVCSLVGGQHPLAIFYGDVGTGKTVTAESTANRLVLEDEKADDSLLFKLSTRVRGTGKVGEMGSLINEAFHKVKSSVGKSRRAFLIIDEGDSLAANRAQNQSHHEDKVAVNTLIQNIDELRSYKGRILVILCTNRLSALDPAIVRRAAITEHFPRPSNEERLALFRSDLGDLGFSEAQFGQLVEATGVAEFNEVTWSYSDIRTRLYPAALAKAYRHGKLEFIHLLSTTLELRPSPVMEDA